MTRFFSWSLLWLALNPPAFAADNSENVTIESFLQNLSTVPGVATLRDPFMEVAPPFSLVSSVKKDDYGPDYNPTNSPLERNPVTDYELVAVLVGDQYPRALLRLPASSGGKVVIVKEKDRLGSHKGVISRISSDGLVVTEIVPTRRKGDSGHKQIVLRVGGSADEQRKLKN